MTPRKPAQPNEVPPSHHQQPKPEGSDCDHTHEMEQNIERRRAWEEQHKQNQPPKKK